MIVYDDCLVVKAGPWHCDGPIELTMPQDYSMMSALLLSSS
jgi:hypothetical protein